MMYFKALNPAISDEGFEMYAAVSDIDAFCVTKAKYSVGDTYHLAEAGFQACAVALGGVTLRTEPS